MMRKTNVIFYKIILRIRSFIKHVFYKLVFLDGFKCKWNVVFYPGTKIIVEEKGKLIIGNKCFFNRNSSLNVMNSIIIGDDCIFGENVHFYDHNHVFSNEDNLIRKQGYKSASIKIGNNCWIGSNVTILSGVTIGDNVVIGAGTIVTKNIPSNSKVYSKQNLYIGEL